MNRAIEAAVRRFPASFSLAYGSAVFPQAARGLLSRDVRAPRPGGLRRPRRLTRAPQTMTDVILAVDDTRKFHEANMAAHPEHYSFLASLGVDAVQAAQSLGARVYYNTHVTVENMVCHACEAARPDA
jgi:translocator assembly and maintenance protein 41